MHQKNSTILVENQARMLDNHTETRQCTTFKHWRILIFKLARTTVWETLSKVDYMFSIMPGPNNAVVTNTYQSGHTIHIWCQKGKGLTLEFLCHLILYFVQKRTLNLKISMKYRVLSPKQILCNLNGNRPVFV